MVFSSLLFLLYFLPFFFLAYFVTPKPHRNWTLLLSSVFFYAWGAPTFVVILLLSTFIDYYLVRWMHKTQEEKKKKELLALSILLNLGLLVYFKYSNFFAENVQAFLSSIEADSFQWTKVILPIGISFYTFQTLTYSIDIYRKKAEPLNNVKDYLLYILMFPQLIAGPIVRFNSIAAEIRERSSKYEARMQGFYRFCIGLAKKVIIANPLGAFVDQNIDIPADFITSGTAWLIILAYAFQIFFDFSGYSDMAIGLGKMMGFTFPENFERPYRSKSITEFWRRWHITLGDWMRDYLYIPLGGNKVSSNARLYVNLCTVFVLSGLWHGASWNFVLWGVFHGVFLILDRLFLKRFLGALPVPMAVLITFFITIQAWVIFRIEDTTKALEFYGRMWSFDGGFTNLADKHQFLFTLILALILSVSPKLNWNRNLTLGWKHLLATSGCAALLILSISMITSSDFNPFIYFRF